jgi:hypothetical protein
MSTAQYGAQVALPVRLLPPLVSEPDFALEGGAATNLFWRDLPRFADPIVGIHAALADADRQFLIGVKTGAPDWSLVGIAHAADLPAVQWKLMNLARLPEDRRQALADRLKAVLAL